MRIFIEAVIKVVIQVFELKSETSEEFPTQPGDDYIMSPISNVSRQQCQQFGDSLIVRRTKVMM